MTEPGQAPESDDYLQKVIEASIRVGLVALLAGWCFFIIRPFVTPVVWGVILAVAVFPAYRWVAQRLGGRPKMAAVLFSILGLAAVLAPAVLLTVSLVDSGHAMVSSLDAESIEIPPPPPEVEGWPVVGEPIYGIWSQASKNLEAVLTRFAPQLRHAALWLVSSGVGVGLALAQSLISIVIAGVLLAGAPSGAEAVNTIVNRLASREGERLTRMAIGTVRSVAIGIVGVAIIQSALIGVGLVLFGVPHAGVWTFLCLLLAIVQLPPMLVVIPIIIYVFSEASTSVAVAFMVWEILASLSDNVLKPVLLARGVEVPMLVIFMGAIGGFMASGFIGLFVGAVVLSVGFELARGWLKGRTRAVDAASEEAAS